MNIRDQQKSRKGHPARLGRQNHAALVALRGKTIGSVSLRTSLNATPRPSFSPSLTPP